MTISSGENENLLIASRIAEPSCVERPGKGVCSAFLQLVGGTISNLPRLTLHGYSSLIQLIAKTNSEKRCTPGDTFGNRI